MVVSPLTSLMLDQHTNFFPRGLKVEFVGEQQCDPSAKQQNVLQGKIQLVYITPENLIENKMYQRMFTVFCLSRKTSCTGSR